VETSPEAERFTLSPYRRMSFGAAGRRSCGGGGAKAEAFFCSSERPCHMPPQIWSQLLINYELICAIASFEALAIFMAVEVWKKTFVMLSPDLV
jgi:hypothetical protein